MSCLLLLMQAMPWALVLAFDRAGRSMPARIAMIAMTTSSSMRVKPGQPEGIRARHAGKVVRIGRIEGCADRKEKPARLGKCSNTNRHPQPPVPRCRPNHESYFRLAGPGGGGTDTGTEAGAGCSFSQTFASSWPR
jgi:hypothetical protein